VLSERHTPDTGAIHFKVKFGIIPTAPASPPIQFTFIVISKVFRTITKKILAAAYTMIITGIKISTVSPEKLADATFAEPYTFK